MSAAKLRLADFRLLSAFEVGSEDGGDVARGEGRRKDALGRFGGGVNFELGRQLLDRKSVV